MVLERMSDLLFRGVVGILLDCAVKSSGCAGVRVAFEALINAIARHSGHVVRHVVSPAKCCEIRTLNASCADQWFCNDEFLLKVGVVVVLIGQHHRRAIIDFLRETKGKSIFSRYDSAGSVFRPL